LNNTSYIVEKNLTGRNPLKQLFSVKSQGVITFH
jgi:hypothetical protein